MAPIDEPSFGRDRMDAPGAEEGAPGTIGSQAGNPWGA